MRKIIPVVAAGAALAVAGTSVGYAALNKDVTMSVDGQPTTVTTTAATVGELLEDQGITVSSRDVVAPAPTAKVTDGTRVAVQFARQVSFTVDGEERTVWTTATTLDQALRALGVDTAGAHLSTSRSSSIGRAGLAVDVDTLKTVTVEVAGKKREVETTGTTVADALAAAKVEVDGNDRLDAKPGDELESGDTITYTRVDVAEVTKKQRVSFSTVRKNSGSLARGKTEVGTTGRSGTRTITYRVVRHDGKVTSRKQTSSKLTERPRSQVVLVGTKAPKVTRRPASSGGGFGLRLERAERRLRRRVGQDRRLRVRRQLEHQHRQRLLRRPAVHGQHLARVRRQRHAAPGQPGRADRRGQAGPGRAGLGRLARLHREAGSPLSLLDPSSVRRIATRLDLRPTKQRGQNFVTDANTVRRIVAASGVGPDDVVLEIGPGLGSLTLGLLDAAGAVVAVEIDELLAGELPATVGSRMPERAGALTVVTADALRLTELPVAPTVVVANLPYNVSVPVLLHLLATFPSWQRGLVMVQLEVADRLVAPPGSKVYGVPSVKMAWYAAATRVGTVPPSVFWPVPNVESGLVAVRRRPAPVTTATRDQVFAVVDAAFAQRRKMLRSALSGLLGSSASASEALSAAGVDPQARGEMLAVDDFARIAEQVAQRGRTAPGAG